MPNTAQMEWMPQSSATASLWWGRRVHPRRWCRMPRAGPARSQLCLEALARIPPMLEKYLCCSYWRNNYNWRLLLYNLNYLYSTFQNRRWERKPRVKKEPTSPPTSLHIIVKGKEGTQLIRMGSMERPIMLMFNATFRPFLVKNHLERNCNHLSKMPCENQNKLFWY